MWEKSRTSLMGNGREVSARQVACRSRDLGWRLLRAAGGALARLPGSAYPRYFTKPCGVNVLAWFACACRIDERDRLGGLAKLDRTTMRSRQRPRAGREVGGALLARQHALLGRLPRPAAAGCSGGG